MVWMERLKEKFEKVIWLNPMQQDYWGDGGSLRIVRQLVEDKMYPLTVEGLEQGMKYLSK